jgi:hypothetical protein
VIWFASKAHIKANLKNVIDIVFPTNPARISSYSMLVYYPVIQCIWSKCFPKRVKHCAVHRSSAFYSNFNSPSHISGLRETKKYTHHACFSPSAVKKKKHVYNKTNMKFGFQGFQIANMFFQRIILHDLQQRFIR